MFVLTTVGKFTIATQGMCAMSMRAVDVATSDATQNTAQTTALGAVAQTIADQGASIQDPAADPVTQGV